MNQPICRLFALIVFTCVCAHAQEIPLPSIPDRVFNITDYSAVGDGKTLNTIAIQKALDACSAAGGGTVLVPAGNFVFGPIILTSSINLHLDPGATLLINNDMTTYPVNNKRYNDCIT